MMKPQPIHAEVYQSAEDSRVLRVSVEPEKYIAPSAHLFIVNKVDWDRVRYQPMTTKIIREVQDALNSWILQLQDDGHLLWDYFGERWELKKDVSHDR
jgi:hypothetical protein